MKNRKINTFIFQVGYTISMFLDILIFRKLHIQLDHSYTRKKYVPCKEYYEAKPRVIHVEDDEEDEEDDLEEDLLEDSEESNSKEAVLETFIYVLFDKDKVVLQNSFHGLSDQKSIDDVTARWYAIVENYVDRHLEFSLSEWWLEYYKRHLSFIPSNPLHILGRDGNWYECIEVGNL